MKVAVFGATGTIGTSLLPLLAREHEVVAIPRKPHEGEAAIEWRQADASDAASVRRALDGADVADHLVHSLGASDFEERDLRAVSTIAERKQSAWTYASRSISAGSAKRNTAADLRSRTKYGPLLERRRVAR